MTPSHIVFHSNQLGLRGTEVALFDYAHYNETLLGNRSTILSCRQSPSHNAAAIKKFKDRFTVIFYDERREVDAILESLKADFFYMIKAGDNDGFVSVGVPNLIHAVFPSYAKDYHGQVYAYVSHWLSMLCSNGKVPYVPHMVNLPTSMHNMRRQLLIPERAFVLGCHGGMDSFDIPFVRQVVADTINKRADLYFLFLNISPFIQHQRILFLPGTPNLDIKAQFIATCDGMLHARLQGESFGLACAEFSIANKPVWSYALSPQQSHIHILGDKAILYTNPLDLTVSILNADRDILRQGLWDQYGLAYSPQAVMNSFQQVFLTPLDNRMVLAQ